MYSDWSSRSTVPKLEIRLGFVDSMNMPDSVNMLTRFREYTSWMLFTQGYKLPKRFVLCRGYPRRVLYLEDSRFLYNPYDNYTSVQRFIFYLIFPWHENTERSTIILIQWNFSNLRFLLILIMTWTISQKLKHPWTQLFLTSNSILPNLSLFLIL